ncbi:MAG: threonylcarbamoyl-AMP synthase [Clostridiales bacterium]|nr:threonylcarbamoyl-AMP synthase [Clostridiales bacterium]
METVVYRSDTPEERRQTVEAAARLLRQGELVAIPTETVYGLAANALDPRAVEEIFRAKGRPNDNPLIVHIADREALPQVVSRVPDSARQLMDRFWPGPLTIILPRNPQVPDATTAGLDTVAVRMPSHPLAREIIRASGLPLAAPSANRSGFPSPTTARHCIDDLTGRVPAIVDGGSCGFGVESTVITLAGEQSRLLRPGAVTLEEMEAVIGPIQVDPAVTDQLQAGAVAASPGMKYKHYSPKARVYLVRGSRESFCRYVNALPGEDIFAMVFDGEKEGLVKPAFEYGAEQDHLGQARELFRLLREFDDLGAREVYVRCPATDGVGLAVYNRLIRAAAFTFIDLD